MIAGLTCSLICLDITGVQPASNSNTTSNIDLDRMRHLSLFTILLPLISGKPHLEDLKSISKFIYSCTLKVAEIRLVFKRYGMKSLMREYGITNLKEMYALENLTNLLIRQFLISKRVNARRHEVFYQPFIWGALYMWEWGQVFILGIRSWA